MRTKIEIELMKTAEIEAIIGTLSAPSKMPCNSTSIPAQKCHVGSRLRQVENSTCANCYALKGNYQFGNVQRALQKRLDAIESPEWAALLTELIRRKEKSGYFRFHDAGDLQSEKHLESIFTICNSLPNIKFWLPTREYAIVSNVLKRLPKPRNLVIRLSAYFVDGALPTPLARRLGVKTSGVTTKKAKANCLSWKQDGKCLDCRKCWSPRISNVNYLEH